MLSLMQFYFIILFLFFILLSLFNPTVSMFIIMMLKIMVLKGFLLNHSTSPLGLSMQIKVYNNAFQEDFIIFHDFFLWCTCFIASCFCRNSPVLRQSSLFLGQGGLLSFLHLKGFQAFIF